MVGVESNEWGPGFRGKGLLPMVWWVQSVVGGGQVLGKGLLPRARV